MQKLKKIAGALASLALLALLVGLTPPGRALAQDARVLMVEVVNRPDVNVSQPVMIGNAPGNPVPVVSVGLPARQTFLAQLFCSGGPFCNGAVTVPSGKLLVIETYSADCGTAVTTTAVRSSISMPQSGTLPYEFFFPLQPSFVGPIGLFGGPGRHHAISSAVRVYAGPGTEVSFNFQVNPAASTLFCQASISGLLVDCDGPEPVCSAP